MLPDPVVLGATLAAATARALGFAYGPSDPEGVLSEDEDALDYSSMLPAPPTYWRV